MLDLTMQLGVTQLSSDRASRRKDSWPYRLTVVGQSTAKRYASILHDVSSLSLFEKAWVPLETKDEEIVSASSNHNIFHGSARLVMFDGTCHKQ